MYRYGRGIPVSEVLLREEKLLSLSQRNSLGERGSDRDKTRMRILEENGYDHKWMIKGRKRGKAKERDKVEFISLLGIIFLAGNV